MTFRIRLLLTSLFLALTSAGAYATDDGKFSKLDKNKDQKISRQEYDSAKDGAAPASGGSTNSAVPSDGGAFSTSTPTTGKTATDPNLKYK
jgi:hypothetical protein